MSENEQWKGDGICAQCRRLKYCKKECTAYRKRRVRLARQLVREKTGISVFEKALGLEKYNELP